MQFKEQFYLPRKVVVMLLISMNILVDLVDLLTLQKHPGKLALIFTATVFENLSLTHVHFVL